MVNKKAIALSVLALMLMGVGYVNYSQSTEPTSATTDQEYVPVGESRLVSSDNVKSAADGENYFKKARINRETERAKSIDLLKQTIADSSTSPEARENAQNQLSKIADNMEIEANAEGIITAKGYNDCVVYISDSAVNAVVASESELTAADTAKIRDIIFEQTNNNNIKIVAVK